MVRHDKMAGIDQGNGPIARHAHASSLNVRRGAWSYADKRCYVGPCERSMASILNFQVQVLGVPRNVARFLATG